MQPPLPPALPFVATSVPPLAPSVDSMWAGLLGAPVAAITAASIAPPSAVGGVGSVVSHLSATDCAVHAFLWSLPMHIVELLARHTSSHMAMHAHTVTSCAAPAVPASGPTGYAPLGDSLAPADRGPVSSTELYRFFAVLMALAVEGRGLGIDCLRLPLSTADSQQDSKEPGSHPDFASRFRMTAGRFAAIFRFLRAAAPQQPGASAVSATSSSASISISASPSASASASGEVRGIECLLDLTVVVLIAD